MANQVAGTSQWRKLVFTKQYSDEDGYVWKISMGKVIAWLVAIILVLIVLFSFFQDDQGNFLKDVLFYSIITMMVVLVLWIVSNVVWKARNFFYRFILGWILILGVYILLGIIFQAANIYPNGFHYGFSTWIVITSLAIGAKNIDRNLDRKDVFFAMLVVVVILIANYPFFSSEAGNIGFLGQLDNFLGWIAEKLSLINPKHLIAQ